MDIQAAVAHTIHVVHKHLVVLHEKNDSKL